MHEEPSRRLHERVLRRESGISVYGIAPPKRSTPAGELAAIAAQHAARFRSMALDGLIVYDIQDESDRTAEPRPFPFLPVVEAQDYAGVSLRDLPVEKIVYRCVGRIPRPDLEAWLAAAEASPQPEVSVLVGAASSHSTGGGVPLAQAYELAARVAPRVILGRVAIPERHTAKSNEHERLLAKMAAGCRFFVTQAVYDASSAKSLLSDYALAAEARGLAPAPVLLTFTPCGSARTLAFMKWLGISFPRWLENELRHSSDILERSVSLCEALCEDVTAFAAEKHIPVGINVESVSIRKAEIEASVALFARLRALVKSQGTAR